MTQDVASLVEDRLSMLITNGIQGLVLVVLVLWLFFSTRHALWVVMGLPVSFAGAVFLMSVMDYQFDMMTLVGLLIAIGIIVDDAIVVSENVAAHREQGKDAISASVDGTLEVLPGVIASFLTTACIFLPLAFLQGDVGNVLKVVPVIMLLTLTVSLIEAFFILPSHLCHSAREVGSSTKKLNGRDGMVQQWLDSWLDRVRDRCIGWISSLNIDI
jgi:HAE1 family hydrophobic/amphiphilic exporter-1